MPADTQARIPTHSRRLRQATQLKKVTESPLKEVVREKRFYRIALGYEPMILITTAVCSSCSRAPASWASLA